MNERIEMKYTYLPPSPPHAVDYLRIKVPDAPHWDYAGIYLSAILVVIDALDETGVAGWVQVQRVVDEGGSSSLP